MKWFCLSAGVLSLGLGVGFWAGKSQVMEDQQEKDLQRGVSSERGVSVRRGRAGGERSVRTSSDRVPQMIDEIQNSGEITDLSKARLIKAILELDASEFPEILKKLHNLDESNSDPFSNSSGGDLVEVAVARWYELEGYSVLDWVLSAPEVFWESERFLGNLLADGYERDPEGSFAYLRQHAEALAGEGGVPVSLAYEIGKWSRDFAGDYIELHRLEAEFELSILSPDYDPFTAEEAFISWESLMEGMLAAGREVELREVLGRLDPGSLYMVDDFMEAQKIAGIMNEGWSSVKSSMDSGAIKVYLWDAMGVLDQWAKVDPEAAVVWYLGLEVESRYSRDEQIQGVVNSEIFQEKTSDGKQLQVEEVVKFLGEMESAGEPVGAGWGSVVKQLVNDDRWDDLERILPQAPQDALDYALREVRSFAVNSEKLSYDSISNRGREMLDRFGMLEKVEAEIARDNEAKLKTLDEVLRQ